MDNHPIIQFLESAHPVVWMGMMLGVGVILYLFLQLIKELAKLAVALAFVLGTISAIGAYFSG